jgi:hypothetical protein
MLKMTAPKSVPVYALQAPDKNVSLRFESADETFTEDAAIISFVYTLDASTARDYDVKGHPRRPAPSLEPEKTIYKNLRPWKKAAVPNYVVVADDSTSLVGAPVVAWDAKRKSLQDGPPWGRPVVGTVSAQIAGQSWAVTVDAEQMALAREQQAIRQAAALEKLIPVVVPPVPVPAPEPVPVPQPVAVAPEPELIAVEGTAVEEEEINFDYTGDPFTVRADGHYVGDDNFVVPANFDEFYERYPKYVLNWVKKRLNRFQVDEDVEDWTQDLLIHMKWLPQASKHRLPGANGRKEGCQDVIETFNPYQQYGASERRFRNYVNFCLANKFVTVQTKRQKNPVCRPGNIPYGNGSEEEHQRDHNGSHADEYIHQNSQHLAAQAERIEKQHDDRLFTNQFKRYVRKEDPGVFPAIEALEACGPMGEAAEYMGVTDQEFGRYRARLKQLAETFLKNQKAPKQRKPYKKRAASNS